MNSRIIYWRPGLSFGEGLQQIKMDFKRKVTIQSIFYHGYTSATGITMSCFCPPNYGYEILTENGSNFNYMTTRITNSLIFQKFDLGFYSQYFSIQLSNAIVPFNLMFTYQF